MNFNLYLITFIFSNNSINYIYFYDKKICLFLNASMHMHGLCASFFKTTKKFEFWDSLYLNNEKTSNELLIEHVS